MQTDSVEKAAGIGAIGLWAALHGWLGWFVVLYAVCMMLDWVTGTVLAIKNGVWSSHKARQGLWHKGGSIIMIFVSVLTDILLDRPLIVLHFVVVAAICRNCNSLVASQRAGRAVKTVRDGDLVIAECNIGKLRPR